MTSSDLEVISYLCFSVLVGQDGESTTTSEAGTTQQNGSRGRGRYEDIAWVSVTQL